MKTLTKAILSVLFILKTIGSFSAEELNFQFSQISSIDGLSQNTVRSIIEDKKGFIWAGTLDGLNRYDGYRILTYKPQLGNINSLIDHRIKDVFQDRDGFIWIKTYKNEFNCYDPVTDSFINFTDEKDTSYIGYYESGNGDIWLWGNTDGCLRVSRNNNVFESTPYFNTEKSTNKRNCKFLYEDSKSVIWVGGESGLYRITDGVADTFYKGKHSFTRATELNNKVYFTTEDSYIIEYDNKRKAFKEIKSPYEKESFVNIANLNNRELLIVTKFSGLVTFSVNSQLFNKPDWVLDTQLKGSIDFIVDKNQGIWIYNHSGIIWYHNPVNSKVKKIEAIPADIIKIIDSERYNIFVDSKGLIWITTYGNGLFCYNPGNDEISNYKYNSNQNSPASDYLLAITEDRYGNIWIGSEYAGIIKIVKPNYSIRIIRPETETSIGKNNNVRTIYEDAFNNYWIGTKNGSLYVYNNSLTNGTCVFKDINPYTLAESTPNKIWVGTKGNGLYIIDRVTKKEIAHYTAGNQSRGDDKSLSHNSVFNILRDNKNRMWIGTFGGGLNLVEESSGGKVSFRHFFVNEGSRSYIRCVYQDSKGVIWVGSSDGVIRFNPDELIKDPKAYLVYKMELNNKHGLNSNDVKTIYEDEEGIIWIGTAGGGLNKFVASVDGQTEQFVAYTMQNGLSGDFITGILEDKNKNLWIGTESGITKFDKKTDSFMVFNFSEKTYGNHFNENANIYSLSGNMFWGSLDGLLMFNPDSFIYKENTSPVVLTNFLLYDQIMKAGEDDSPLTQSISYSDDIKLNYQQNTFTVEFATLDMKDPQKNKYVYMLENYDKQWNSISQVNGATYKNLPPGKYVFRVKGANGDGAWNEDITSLDIKITPPFWRSNYAYLIYFILGILALYFAFRLMYKFNILNNNIKVEKELTNYKLRFFTNISHEFRTPLTLIRGAVENLNSQAETSEQTKKQVKVLNRNTTILTRLIEQLLEFRKIQNNVLTLDLEEIDIVDFCKEIYNNFEEIAVQKNIEYLFITEVDNYKMFIDKRKIDKIIYNLLSNAFKFTPKGGKIEFVISFNASLQTCQISVKDNGIGIEKDKQHLLFSRFTQINFSYAGTGVGLSLVKEFVDVHKGKVWYEDNKGGGAIFRVELSTSASAYRGENFVTASSEDVITADNSIISSTSDQQDRIQLPEIEDSALSNYKMLIIDDNDDIRNFLADEFSKHFMVDTAENGKIGLQKAIENNPDLIICDVMMPEMDGFEVTSRLKEDFQTCHIPVILLTAHSSIEHQLEGIKSGADAYIMKPFSLQYLVARVFKLIEQREQLKKRFSRDYIFDGNLITTTDKDKEFFNLIEKILDSHMTDSQFSVDKFAELSKLSRTIFYKKVKGITGLSPNEFIKVRRLKYAAGLILEGDLTISEIAFKVGFDDPYYFSRCFKAQYNCSPSKYGQVETKDKGGDM